MSESKIKRDMERVAGRPLTFVEDGLVTLLDDAMPIQEIKTAPDLEYHPDSIEIRIEALKLAYDTAHKVGNFSRSYAVGSLQFKKDIDDVFALADMNIDYIIRK